jgi:uncharacterized membrane-anchored protein
MRKAIVLIAGVLVLIVTNVGIYQKEQLEASGRPVLLELAPVDPRSLMQGDYMALRFRVADEFWRIRRKDLRDGRIVLTLDARNIGTFARFDDGTPAGPQEIVMRYRIRGGTPKLATNAYFFEEGQGQLYAAARYGEFRVSPSGDAILTGLRGDKLEILPRRIQ